MADNVEGSPVIDECSGDWQAKGDVDTPLKIQLFAWNVNLIMTHADNIEFPFSCGQIEHRIGWQWPFLCAHSTAELILPDFFVTEQSVFARVRIQASHGNARIAFQLLK